MISLAAHIESQSAGEIKVFTLPYLDFPEGRPSYAMYDYELAKPSVYTNRVKYSYGAIKGSFLDKKYKAYSELDSKTLVSVLRMEGFNGILIDVKGYQKYPVDLIKLTDILGVPYVTQDNVWVYYKL